MPQLPNVKDEMCKNQDRTDIVSQRRHREAENKNKAERQGVGGQKNMETAKESPNRLCIKFWCRKDRRQNKIFPC